jgi:predicted permease
MPGPNRPRLLNVVQAFRPAVRRLLPRFRNAIAPTRAEDELARETAAHLALLEDEHQRRGMTADDARIAARRSFGGVEQMKDRQRDARSFVWLDDARRDLEYAARMLRRTPGFSAAAIVTLALGIGANTAVFLLFDAVLLNRLPVRDPQRLVLFSDGASEGTATGDMPEGRWRLFSTEVFEHLRRQSLPFASLAAVRSGQATVAARLTGGSSDSGSSLRARAHLVSGNYFTTMGVGTTLGRALGVDDERPDASPVAVVSDGFWKRRLRGDRAAIGTVVTLNGTAFTIVGVTPSDFFGERVRQSPDFWIPLRFQPQIELRPSYVDRADAYWLNLVGRLSDEATPVQAQTAATTALRQFLQDAAGTSPDPDRIRAIQGSHVELADGAGGISGLRQTYAAPLRVLLAVVALVLLIACANVGNLLLSRAAARRGEMAVRLALGASRARLTRQLLTESLLLATLGALSGVLLARWAAAALLTLVAAKTSPVHTVFDAQVFGFTAAISILAAVVFGLTPALNAGRRDLVAALKSGSRSVTSRRWWLGAAEALVAAQIAASLVLLVGASLFARSLLNLEGQPLGFEQEHVLLAGINPRLAGYTTTTVEPLYRSLYDRLNALPGVRSATFARYSPRSGGNSVNAGRVEGYVPRPGEPVSLETILVGPSYPETLGIAITQGRSIGPRDDPRAPKVAMVNEAFVRRFLRDQNPIGRHLTTSGSASPLDVEIVGVLEDVQFQSATDEIRPIVFTAMRQDASQFALDCEIEVRAAGDPATIANEVRQTIAGVDRNLPVADLKTLREQVAATFGSQRLAAGFVSAFSGLALVLACVGLYGVVAQTVSRRTNEIGLRLALGAQTADVFRMILWNTLRVVVLGLTAGLAVALAASRLVASQLFGITAGDPLSFAIAAGMMTGVAAIASLLPARRAMQVDPLTALRSE